jgi:type III pantothenate kinase
MNFKLCIDIGNTTIGLAIVIDGASTQIEWIPTSNPEAILGLECIKKSEITRVIIASVVPEVTKTCESICKSQIPQANIHVITHEDCKDFALAYEKREDLGVDRLVLLRYAASQYPKDKVMIVDFGTAITVDLLESGIHRGGMISLGVQQRLSFLSQATAMLPDLLSNLSEVPLWGKSTEECIRSGVYHEIALWLQSLPKNFSFSKGGGSGCTVVPFSKREEKVIYLATGGNCFLFEKTLPWTISDRHWMFEAIAAFKKLSLDNNSQFK